MIRGVPTQTWTQKGVRWATASALLTLAAAGIVGLRARLHAVPPIDASKLGVVERGDIAHSVVATGKIQPLIKVDVKSRASGIVRRVFVNYGDTVNEGHVLIELDKEELQARLREAQASLQAAEASMHAGQAAYERNQLEAELPELSFLQSAVTRT